METGDSWDHWDNSTQFLGWQWQCDRDGDAIFYTRAPIPPPAYDRPYPDFIFEVVVHVLVHLMLLELVPLLPGQVLLLLVPDGRYFLPLRLPQGGNRCLLLL